MNNKYYKRSRISEAKFRHLSKCFSLDLTATETAQLAGISLRSVTVIFDWNSSVVRAASSDRRTIEVDESYFGPRRIPGKRGWGTSGKTIVFGIFKRQG